VSGEERQDRLKRGLAKAGERNNIRWRAVEGAIAAIIGVCINERPLDTAAFARDSSYLGAS
jgi:hypothetical protein